jgi:dienelactone hydrolase
MADDVSITADSVSLPGTLTVPADASGTVVFAHGSGSSRLSRRNVAVAETLSRHGCATLLFDLLTPEEAADRRNVFDIELLGTRVGAATDWLTRRPDCGRLPVGYFGASTGAAAALVAAAVRGATVAAVVSRGGRPDLAGEALGQVTAPTLLLVGSLDTQVLELNRQAQRALQCRNELQVIDGATHLFEEPGTLEAVAEAACSWFLEAFREQSR